MPQDIPQELTLDKAQDKALDIRCEHVLPREESTILTLKKNTPWLTNDNPFVIPCKIGSLEIDKALCDSGASVNLIPFSVYNKLGSITLEDTEWKVPFVDKSTKEHEEVLQNVLVQIQDVHMLTNFFVVDIEEDAETPIILGKPFFNMTEASFHMKGRSVHMKVGDEIIIFYVHKTSSARRKELECKRDDDSIRCLEESKALSTRVCMVSTLGDEE